MWTGEAFEREMPVSYEQELYLTNEPGFCTGARDLEAAADLADEIAGGDLLDNSFVVDLTVHMRGSLDRSILCKVMNEIVRRHAVFRTTFHNKHGRIVQRIHPAGRIDIREIDLAGYPDSVIEAVISYEAARVMDLTLAPPLNISLIRRAKDDHVLCISIHHIIFDGWSGGILSREFIALYNAFASGHASSLPEPKMQYADYMLQPRAPFLEPRLSVLLSYWKSKLNGMGATPLVEFAEATVPPAPIYSRRFKSESGPPSLIKKMNALARETRATVFMVFIAAVASWIFRRTGQTDIGLLYAVENRDAVERRNMIGWLANQLVLRLNVDGSSSLADVLDHVQSNMIKAMSHSDLPFLKLKDIFPNERPHHWNSKQSTVFVAMGRQANAREPICAGTLKITDFPYTPVNFICDQPAINIHLTELATTCNVTLGYPPEWFDDGKIARIISDFMTLLNDLIDNPLAPIVELPFGQNSAT